MSPVRIQRQRTKGWRMPEGAIYVGRPAWWGNPYPIRDFGRLRAVELFRNSLMGHWSPSPFAADEPDWLINAAYRTHEWMRQSGRRIENVRHDLRGHDLACWCPLDQPCHADVLLELANLSI